MISAKMTDVLACCKARYEWEHDIASKEKLDAFHDAVDKTFPSANARTYFRGFVDPLFLETDLSAEAIATLCRLFIRDVEEGEGNGAED